MTIAEKKAVLDEFKKWLFSRIGTGNGIGFTILEKLDMEIREFCKNKGNSDNSV